MNALISNHFSDQLVSHVVAVNLPRIVYAAPPELTEWRAPPTYRDWDDIDRLLEQFSAQLDRSSEPHSKAFLARIKRLRDGHPLRPDGYVFKAVISLEGTPFDHHPSKEDPRAGTAHAVYLCAFSRVACCFAAQSIVRSPGFPLEDGQAPMEPLFVRSVEQAKARLDPGSNGLWQRLSMRDDQPSPHSIEMLIAQLTLALELPNPWSKDWLDDSDAEALLARNNRTGKPYGLRALIHGWFDANALVDERGYLLTPSRFLQWLGVERPTVEQSRACVKVLDEIFGEPILIADEGRWPVPCRNPSAEQGLIDYQVTSIALRGGQSALETATADLAKDITELDAAE